MCTTRFESFNAKVRAHNIYGTRRAPSRDIAVDSVFCNICNKRDLSSTERYMNFHPVHARAFMTISKVRRCSERDLPFSIHAACYFWHSNARYSETKDSLQTWSTTEGILCVFVSITFIKIILSLRHQCILLL